MDDGAAAWRGEVVGHGDAARLNFFSLCGPREGWVQRKRCQLSIWKRVRQLKASHYLLEISKENFGWSRHCPYSFLAFHPWFISVSATHSFTSDRVLLVLNLSGIKVACPGQELLKNMLCYCQTMALIYLVKVSIETIMKKFRHHLGISWQTSLFSHLLIPQHICQSCFRL